MKAFNSILRFAILLVAVPAFVASLPKMSPAGRASSVHPIRGEALRLRRGVLDPASPEGQILEANFRASLAMKAGSSDRRLAIVRCSGTDQDIWRAAAQAAGVDVIAPVPDDALLVRGNPSALGRFAEEPPVSWIGEFGRLEKLAPALDADLALPTGPNAVPAAILILADADGLALAESLSAEASARFLPVSRVGDFLIVRAAFAAGRLAELLDRPEVVNVEPWRAPAPQDERAGVITSGLLDLTGKKPSGPGYLDWLASKGFTGETFDFGIDVVDSGLDTGIPDDPNGHPDFRSAAGTSRIAYAVSFIAGPQTSTSDFYGHGTLNASIAAGFNAGSAFPQADSDGYRLGLGIAPFARLGGSKIFNRGDGISLSGTYTDIASHAYRNGMRFASNSWGAPANSYTVESMEYDAIVRDADPAVSGNQEFTVCFAAGNAHAGGTILTPATGKNVITVGASEGYRPEGIVDGCGVGDDGADAADDIVSFSSGGPLDDGRTKPDLVAPGTHVQGCASQHRFYTGGSLCVNLDVSKYYPLGQTLYAWASGTSQSTPVVAGAAALIRAYCVLEDWFDGAPPSPAMVKALLVGSSTPIAGMRAGRQLPDSRQGFGRVSLGPVFDDAARILVDQKAVFSTAGETYVETGDVGDPARPFRVALVWTDAPGLPNFAARVNDLDLEVRVGETVYRGNAFTGFESTPDPSAPFDAINNVETVTVPAGFRGPFTVTVRAATIAGDGVPGNADATDQDFALVIYNIEDGRWVPIPPPEVTSVLVKSRPASVKLTVAGLRMPATTAFEINGRAVEPVRIKFQASKNSFRIKGPIEALGATAGENTLVAIDGDLRSEPWTFVIAPPRRE